jgi:phenylacetate-CoA ligase
MSSALYRLVLQAVLWALWLLRRLISLDGSTYALINAQNLQRFLARVGRMGAHAVYLKARATCPAYQNFLTAMGYEQKGPWRLDHLPEMTKENYVKKYSIEQRCYGGAIPKGLSEGLRSHLGKYARSVISSFGASDLEINIAVETELTIALRRLCLENRKLSKQLFGRDTPPMIFQYNALDYTIETNDQNELLFTIGRQSGAAPKIRYNLRDTGGSFSFSSLSRVLQNHGVLLSSLASRYSSFPLLFVYGRNDATVPFYGAKIYPADLERVINEDPVLASEIHSFQLKVIEDEQLKSNLQVHLELSKNRRGRLPSGTEYLQELIFTGLIRVNQDFREVTKMFDRSQVQIFLHEYGTGPFAGRDIRIKNKYIA